MATPRSTRARVARRGRRTARATCRTCPSNVATPEFLAERAGEIADEYDSLSIEVLGREEIEGAGMGAFTAVAQGTDRSRG